MPKTKISEFSSTPANNTDIDSINIAEGCAPSGINDAIRELMAQLKDWQSGTSNDPMVIGSSGSLTLNQGTANGVAYLNGSKVVTSGSALTFDGTNLGIGLTGGVPLDVGGAIRSKITGGSPIYYFNDGTYQLDLKQSGNAIVFDLNSSSEAMRLTSTGLGIGTSSPAQKLHVDQTSTGTVWAKISNGSSASGAAAGVLFGSNAGDMGAISILSSNNSPADALFLRSLSTNPLVFGTNNTERARIDSSGNLLVGDTTSAYSAKIYANGIIAARNGGVDGTFQNAFIAGYTSNYTELNAIQSAVSSGGTLSGWRFQASVGGGSGTTYKTLDSLRDVTIFYTQNTERVRIDSSGNLLLNTTSSRTGVNSISIEPSGNNYIEFRKSGSGSSTQIQFNRNTDTTPTSAGSISTTGTTASYNTSSDYRLKQDIAPITNALDKVTALKPVTFKWNTDGSDGEGFIAHELAEVCPQAVNGEKDAVDEDGNPQYQGIDTSFLVATLTAALQELNAKFDAYVASHP